MVSYYVTFVVTVYREFFGEPNSSPHKMSRGFITLHAKPHKPMCFGLGFYEAWGFAQTSNPPYRWRKCGICIYWKFMMIVGCMWTLSYFIDHASSIWPPHRNTFIPSLHLHCKTYLVEMTTSAWLLEFQGSLNRWVVWLKKFQNTNIIHKPIHNSFKLQRASTDTCH